MAIPTSTVDAALSLVSTLAKLRGRVDNVLAEKEAVRSDLALPPFSVQITTGVRAMSDALKALLQDTQPASATDPDPLGTDRQKIEDTLSAPDSQAKTKGLRQFMLQYLPDQLETTVINPAADLQQKLDSKQKQLGLTQDDIDRLIFYLGAGDDLRDANTSWQLATNVVNVLAEMAVQNQALLIKDKGARQVVGAVLERFAAPDLLQIGSGQQLLTFALSATINGALDARDVLGGNKAWLTALLSALATARTTAAQGDDFVFGLLQGRGYPTLVSSLLQQGAASLSDTDASTFETVVADVLTRAATVVQDSQDGNFEAFFQDHWGDLLRAGLQAVQAHGPAILAGTNPLLQQTLLAVVDSLAASTDRTFLSSDTFVSAIEAAIGAVAANPALLDDTGFPDWLKEVLGSVATVVSKDGVQDAFSATGLQNIVQGVFGTLANHPELLGDHPKIIDDLVGSVLEALSETQGLRLEDLAQASIQGALEAVSKNPSLLGTDFGPTVAQLAGTLAAQVKAKTITGVNARDILAAALDALAASPLVLKLKDSTDPAKAALVTFVETLTGGDVATVLNGVSLSDVVGAALTTVARNPALLGSNLGTAIRTLAGKLAVQVNAETLSGLDARDLLLAVLETVESNPAVLAFKDSTDPAKAALVTFVETLTGGDVTTVLQGVRLHAVLQAALAAIAQNPGLLGTAYGQAIADLAAALADKIKNQSLHGLRAEALFVTVVRLIAQNPTLLATADKVAAKVITLILEALGSTDAEGVIQSQDVVALIKGVLAFLARNADRLAPVMGDTDGLLERLEAMLKTALDRALKALGQHLSLGDIVPVVLAFLDKWAKGLVPTDLASEAFQTFFATIMDEVTS